MEKVDEGVRDRGTILAGIELVGKRVEGKRILAEKGNVEDCFCVWEIEAGEVGVQSGFR